MRNYAASATFLRQTTLFADTHALAFIASQWAIFKIFNCDEKTNNTYIKSGIAPTSRLEIPENRKKSSSKTERKRDIKGYTLFALLGPFNLGHTRILTS